MSSRRNIAHGEAAPITGILSASVLSVTVSIHPTRDFLEPSAGATHLP